MPPHKTLALTLLCLLLGGLPAFAQGGGDDDAYSEAEEGPVSEDDIVALAEFTAWCYERVVQLQDPSLSLPDDAAVRAVDFWGYVAPALDQETIEFIGEMEVIWPAVQENWAAASRSERGEISESALELVAAIWGSEAGPTASYLALEITYEDFVPSMDSLLAAWAEGTGSDDGSGEDNGEGRDTIHDAVSTYLGNFIEY